MDFKLEHCGNCIEIRNFEHSREDEVCGNPYNSSFQLFVKSDLFQGFGDCTIDIKEFRNFACEIVKMYDFKQTKVTLKDICYGSFVDFEMNKLGQVEISGKIYSDTARHSLKFHFMADQTSLKTFSTDLNRLLVMISS